MNMRRGRPWIAWTTWITIYGLVGAMLYFLGPSETPAHGLLLYLLIAVGASVAGGRGFALLMVAAGYLAVDFWFVPPLHTIGLPSQQDGIILIGFAAVGLVVVELVQQFRRAARRAELQAAEVSRLAEERGQMEAEIARATVIVEADRLKNALLASLSHDLRTPLATIKILAEDRNGNTTIAMQRIRDETSRLNAFLDEVREFSRSLAGDVQVRTDMHVIEDLVGSALRAADASLRNRSVVCEQPDELEPLVATIDFTLSLRALVNLVENAARYSPPGSGITIVTRRAGDSIEVSVCDSGPRLQPQVAEELFKPFRRGPGTDPTGGAGLGLSIARTFARAQGGDVVYRAGPTGSEFVLVLPAGAPARPLEPAPELH